MTIDRGQCRVCEKPLCCDDTALLEIVTNVGPRWNTKWNETFKKNHPCVIVMGLRRPLDAPPDPYIIMHHHHHHHHHGRPHYHHHHHHHCKALITRFPILASPWSARRATFSSASAQSPPSLINCAPNNMPPFSHLFYEVKYCCQNTLSDAGFWRPYMGLIQPPSSPRYVLA